MKTRSLGIAFAALLAFAPVRSNAASSAAPSDAASAAKAGDPPASVPRPSTAPKTAQSTAATTEAAPRKPRRYAKKHRYTYWEPFPVYWPHYHRHRLSWQRVAWLNWL